MALESSLDPLVAWVAESLRASGALPRERVLDLLRGRGASELQALLVLARGLDQGALQRDPHAPEHIGSRVHDRPAEPPAPAADPRRIVLIVEDDAAVREALTEVLEDQGYCVFCAGNGAEALRTLPQIPRPAVILLDLMMPIMNGWELAAALRIDDRFRDIPIAVCSAHHDRTPPELRFVPKPINLVHLIETVEELRCRPGLSAQAG